MILVSATRSLIVIGLMAGFSAIVSAAPMRDVANGGFRLVTARDVQAVSAPPGELHRVRFVARKSGDQITDDDTTAANPRYPVRGDKSGYPGGNEFDPTAPFGGQAAVTAQPGTPGYDEQMNQRRYFCEYASNRC